MLALKEVSSLLVTEALSREPSVGVFAPNFETRTVSILDWIAQYRNGLRMTALRIVLQASSNRNEVLEEVKQLVVAHADEQLKGIDPTLKCTDIRYPDGFNIKTVHNAIDKTIAKFKKDHDREPMQFLFDVTGMPRKMMLAVTSWICNKAKHGRTFVTYSPAGSYPKDSFPPEIGALIDLDTDEGLFDLEIADRDNAYYLAIPGKQGFDVSLLLDVVPLKNKLTLILYLDRDNPAHFFHILRANQPTLANVDRLHVQTITSHGLLEKTFRDILEECIREQQDLIVASFGPKPVAMSLMLIRETAGHLPIKVRFIGLRAHHYGSVYSIGSRQPKFYEISPL